LRLKIKKLTDPFIAIQKKALRKVKEEADKYIKPLEQIEDKTRTLIVDYELRKEEEIKSKLKAAATDETKINMIDEKLIEDIQKKPLSSSAGIRRTYKVLSVDEKLLPEKYFIKTVDYTTLNMIAKETKGEAVIAGVVFGLA